MSSCQYRQDSIFSVAVDGMMYNTTDCGAVCNSDLIAVSTGSDRLNVSITARNRFGAMTTYYNISKCLEFLY